MLRPPSVARTYAAYLLLGRWAENQPLGTLVCPSRRVARELAAARWPHAPRDLLRVASASCVPADVLGRCLALDASPSAQANLD